MQLQFVGFDSNDTVRGVYAMRFPSIALNIHNLYIYSDSCYVFVRLSAMVNMDVIFLCVAYLTGSANTEKNSETKNKRIHAHTHTHRICQRTDHFCVVFSVINEWKMHKHTQRHTQRERPITSIAALISTTNKLTYLKECCGTYISGVESQRIHAYDRDALLNDATEQEEDNEMAKK